MQRRSLVKGKGLWAVNFDGATKLQNGDAIPSIPPSSPMASYTYMQRRSLLIGTAAALVAPKIGIAAPSHKGCWAVNFDGATRLQNDGTIANMPGGSPYGMASYLYNSPGTFTSPNQLILGQATAANQQNFMIYQLWNGRKGNGGFLQLVVQFNTGSGPGSGGGHVTAASSINTSLPMNSTYNLIQVGWDLTIPQVVMTLNLSPLAMTMSKTAPYSDGPQYNSWGGVPMKWYVGGGIFSSGGYYKGMKAELFFFAGAQVNIFDPSVQAGFWDTETNKPVRNSPDGWTALGPLLGISPQVYMSGPESLFRKNYPGWDFTWTDAGPDSGPSAFYTSMGALTTAALDPWGFTGV